MELRLNINVTGVGRIAERVKKIDPAMKAAQTPASMAMGELVRKEAVRILQQPKSGQHWTQDRLPPGWRYLPHPSGVSGGPPASQYGGLINSIIVRPTRSGYATVEAGVGLYRPYAKWLELGFTTIFRKRSVVFPFLRPATEAMTPKFPGVVRDELKKHMPL